LPGLDAAGIISPKFKAANGIAPMTNTNALDDRSKGVLKSVIQIHIATGEPVGSESVCRRLERAMSPATIRAIMSDLERLGYLDHPHTSAGRRPTDEGYRFYVNSLMSEEPLTAENAAAIDARLRAGANSPAQVIENASHILSRLSRSVGFVLAPELVRMSFMHVDLVRLPHPRILVVMVSQAGMVVHRVIDIEEPLTQDDLRTCANYLNAHFAGMNLLGIRRRLLELMQEDKAAYDLLLKRVFAVADRAFPEAGEGANVYLDGTSNILDKPEFDDVEKMRGLFQTFEEKGRLVKILNECMRGEGIRIFIGHENPDPNLHGVAVVATGLPVGGESGWGLGVMGSTRMEYPRIVSLVDHVARSVGRAVEEIA
jgi:heat-inducible transcriptional repressor